MDLVRLFRICNVYITESISSLDNLKLDEAKKLKENIEAFNKISEATATQVAAMISQLKEQMSAPIAFFKASH
jgi:hypothetical protein